MSDEWNDQACFLLDPEPWVKDMGDMQVRSSNSCGGWPVVFEPRSEFEQDLAWYSDARNEQAPHE